MTTPRKPSLSAALQTYDARRPEPAAEAVAPAAAERAGEGTATPPPPGRRGKKMIAGYFDPAVSHQIKQLALDNGSSVQALLTEALNDLFAKHGKPPIA